MKNMETFLNCLVCNSKVELSFNSEGFDIYVCVNCGLGISKNTKKQIGAYHRDDEYIEEENLFKNIFLKRVNIVSNLSQPGKVLEVGCSTGLLLSLFKERGWEVTGIEVSKKAAEIAQKRGINVTVDYFEKAEIKEKYDLIIFNHVFEHVENPQDVMEKTYELLKPGGIVLISLPNFNSLSAKLLKGNWPMLLPKEHLWQFTAKSLEILLGKYNLKVVYSETVSGIWDLGNPFLGLWYSLIGMKKRFFTELLTAVPDFILTKLSLGSGLIIVAKKK